jgi:hypothetical protein
MKSMALKRRDMKFVPLFLSEFEYLVSDLPALPIFGYLCHYTLHIKSKFPIPHLSCGISRTGDKSSIGHALVRGGEERLG